jgi:hypothetical protein
MNIMSEPIINIMNAQISHHMTCVSGFWKVKNKHNDNYINWFETSLKINCPYVFFSDKDTIEIIKKYRQNLPTFYVECNISDFITNKYKDKMLTHKLHCPSVELNLIWNEKIFLIKKAFELNPFLTDFFCWVDAGICLYRNKPPPSTPFPNLDKLYKLPTHKFIYSSSQPYNPGLVTVEKYYHHISGTTYILHKSIINDFCKLYENYLDTLINTNNIWTDQVILTHIFKDHSHLFYKLCHGYGEIFPHMY